MTDRRFRAKNGVDNNGNTLVNLAEPVASSDAATRGFSSNASNLSLGTVPAGRMPAFTGDITVSVGTTVATLASTLTGDRTLDGNLTVNGNLGVRASAAGTGPTQVAVFASNPASTAVTLQTRTPAQLLGDIGAAPTVSPALTGIPTAPTASGGTNNTQIATTAFVVNSLAAVNAATATALQTPRLINGTAFDGTQNIVTDNWGAARNISIGGTSKAVNGSLDLNWSTSEIAAQTAVTLSTARTINGTSFNGSANITTANWGTSRNITIGSTAKGVDGSANVSWSLTEIGAASRVITVSAGDGLSGGGDLTANRTLSVDSTVVRTTGNQSLAGIKTFTEDVASTTPSTGSIVISGTGGLGVGGNVNIGGSLNAISKSFVIPHPSKPNKLLRHGSLEGPEYGVYIRGRSTSSRVELPEYWSSLVDPNTITVHLTPLGRCPNPIYCEAIREGVLLIANEGTEYSYIVYGERRDIPRLEVEVSRTVY